MPLPYYVSPEQMWQGEVQPKASRANSRSDPGGPA
jgi:hypothetical protein